MGLLPNESIYLDHNATTPLLPEVAEAMRECYAAPYYNPASQHEYGRRARRLLEECRERIAALLGAELGRAPRDQLVFTSGGTESNNLAIRGLTGGGGDSTKPAETPHLIVSAVEHPSVTSLVVHMRGGGAHVDFLAVDANGVVETQRLAGLLRPQTRAVAVMLGQNETGVLQPVTEVASICAAHGVPLHTDAAQVVGKLPVDFRALGVATMSIAAHKFHGPVGIGALLVRHGVALQPQLFGGFQQEGLRPGTQSVALAVGMCRALELWEAERTARSARLEQLRDRLEHLLLAGWPAAVVIGAGARRLPHTSHVAFVGLDRQALFLALDRAGVACSTGSACASGSSEPSPVLAAMGCPADVIGSALRFSLGVTMTAEQVDEAARRITRCCKDLGRRKLG